MAHFSATTLTRPTHFNFANDVVDYWATKSPPLMAMHWVSQDQSQILELSYAHFQRESHRIAVLLKSLGVKQGDTVLMILPRIPEWWEVAVATLRSGVVICPATTLLVGKDIEFRANMTGAVVFVGDAVSVGKFMNVRKNCPQVRYVIQINDTGPVKEGVTDFRKEMERIPSNAIFETRNTRADDKAMVYFTSGTSGPPKMVLHNQVSYPLGEPIKAFLFGKRLICTAHTITGKHVSTFSAQKLSQSYVSVHHNGCLWF